MGRDEASPTLRIGPEWYDRDERLDANGDVGHGYARRADDGGQRLHVRVAMIGCPECDGPLYLAQDSPEKVYRCGTPACRRTFRLALVQEPGRSLALALIADRF